MGLGLGFQIVTDGEECFGIGITVAIVDVVLWQGLEGVGSYKGKMDLDKVVEDSSEIFVLAIVEWVDAFHTLPTNHKLNPLRPFDEHTGNFHFFSQSSFMP